MARTSIELEYLFRASPTILYQFLTTPACLVRWFCDKCDVQGDYFVYVWSGYAQLAEVVDDIEEERLRLKWEDAPADNEYLEFRIFKARVTEETVLQITDFCDDDEIQSQTDLWNEQIKRLRQVMGG